MYEETLKRQPRLLLNQQNAIRDDAAVILSFFIFADFRLRRRLTAKMDRYLHCIRIDAFIRRLKINDPCIYVGFSLPWPLLIG